MHNQRLMQKPPPQSWEWGERERPFSLCEPRLSLGQGELPGPPCGLRRAPGQRRTPTSDDVAERADRASRRQRLAGAVLTCPRLQEDGEPPTWLHGPQAYPRGPGGQRGQPWRGDGYRLRRGAGRPAEGHPPAEEEEGEPEQEEAGPPETPGTVIPSTPVVQECRDIVERGSGAHGRSSSRWGSPSGFPGMIPSRPPATPLGTDRRVRPLCLPQARRGQCGVGLRQASPGVLGTLYQPQENLSSVLTIHAVVERWIEGLESV